MADKKIHDLADAAPLLAADLYELEQPGEAVGTRSRKGTLGALKTFIAGNEFVNIALSDMGTELVVGTKTAYWIAPEDGELVGLMIGVETVSSSGLVTVDMNDSTGTTVLTTPPSIDASEHTNLTGTATVVASPVTFVKGDYFTFDIDAAGTGAKALQGVIEYTPA